MSEENVQGMAEPSTGRTSTWLALHGGFTMAMILVMFLVLGLFFRMSTSAFEGNHDQGLYSIIPCCFAALLLGLAIIVPGKLKASIETTTSAILAIASGGLLYAIIFQMPEINGEFRDFTFQVDQLFVFTNLYYLVYPYIIVQIMAIIFQLGTIARVVATRAGGNPSTPGTRWRERVDLGFVAGFLAILSLALGILPYLNAKDVYLLGVCWMLANPAIIAIAGKKTGQSMMEARSAVEPSRPDAWKPWIAAASLVLLVPCLMEFDNKVSSGDIGMLVISLPWFCAGIGISFAGCYGLSIARIKDQPFTILIALGLQALTSRVVLSNAGVLTLPGYFIVAGIIFGWIMGQVFTIAFPVNNRKLARGGLAMLILLLGVVVIGLNILGVNLSAFVNQGYPVVVIIALGLAAIFWIVGFLAWLVPRHRKSKNV